MTTELSTYEVGPMGGPIYLPWQFEPSKRPAEDDAVAAFQRLTANWSTIAGELI
jgi:hypothetical protein